MLETAALIWGLADATRPPQPQATGPSFAVSYRAAADCPTRAQFEAAILARAPGARRRADSSEAEVRFEAELTVESGKKRRLHVTLDDGSSQDREIEADDCAEAVQSMAVIAAMILSSRVATPEPAPSAAEAATAPEPEPEPEPEVTAGRASVRPARGRDHDGSAPARRNAGTVWLAVGGGVGIESSAAPSPTYAASASAELGRVTRSVLAPSLRLSLLFGQALDTSKPPIGDARFQLALARVHGCVLRLETLHADVRACAVLEGGALLARGVHARNQHSFTVPWFAAGLGAIGGLRVAPRLTIELSGSVRRLIVRDEFIFAPGTPVHQPSVFAGDFRLGLAYRLR